MVHNNATTSSAIPFMEELYSIDTAIRSFSCVPAYEYINKNEYVIPFGAVLAYFFFLVVGDRVMRDQKPMKLKHLFAAWNLSLSLFSLWGVSVVFPWMYNSLRQKGYHYTVCSEAIRFGRGSFCDCAMGVAVTLFMFSKIPELFDTVFLVLMKKPVIVLQWWHHATVLLYSWWAAVHAIPSSGPMAAMNYAVHAIMYFYFATSQYTRALSFLRMPIMLMQLSQMAVGLAIVLSTYFYSKYDVRGCTDAYSDYYFVYCGLMYGSYFVLFGKMYLDTFVFKTRRQVRSMPDTQPAKKAL